MNTYNQTSHPDGDVVIGYADLSPQQRKKCAPFLSFYNDEHTSVRLTQLIDKSGENSYKRVLDKLAQLMYHDKSQQLYHDELYKHFPLDIQVTTAQIIGTVGKVRRELGMSPYFNSMRVNCERDFLQLFIVRVSTIEIPYEDKKTGDQKTKTVKNGYTPIFKLKP